MSTQPNSPAPGDPGTPARPRRWPWIAALLAAFLAGVGVTGATVRHSVVQQTAAPAPVTTTSTVTATAQATAAPPVTIVSTVSAPPVTVTETATRTVTPSAGAAGRSRGDGTLGDGVHRMGTDAQAGRWKTPGPSGSRGCYWSRLRDDSGDFEAIIANDIVQGPTSVTVRSGEFLELSGGCTWSHE